jgi:hypothetical protein
MELERAEKDVFSEAARRAKSLNKMTQAEFISGMLLLGVSPDRHADLVAQARRSNLLA